MPLILILILLAVACDLKTYARVSNGLSGSDREIPPLHALQGSH